MIRAALALVALAGPAFAHDWYTGMKSAEGLSCCSGKDCSPIPPAAVSCGVDSCDVTLAPGDHPEAPEGGRFIFRGIPGSSPDMDSHACIWWPGREQQNTPEGYDGVIRCMWFGGGS